MVGVKIGRLLGPTIALGVLQLAPPSPELVNRTSLSKVPAAWLRFLSKFVELSQTTYSFPEPSMATSCRPSPTRACLPVLGSITPAALKGAITWGDVHVAPPSVDFTNASSARLATPLNGVLGGTIRSVKSYSVSVLES